MNDAPALKIESTSHRDVVVVKPVGRVVRENAGQLRQWLESAVQDGARRIALDLEKIEYMDSAGLGCCSYGHKLLSGIDHGAVAAFGAPEKLEKMWYLIRLDLVIPLFSTSAEACDWLRDRG
jgi:anti-sigma B factor antagonist